jgi:hypothetical protein
MCIFIVGYAFCSDFAYWQGYWQGYNAFAALVCSGMVVFGKARQKGKQVSGESRGLGRHCLGHWQGLGHWQVWGEAGAVMKVTV